MTMYNRKSNGWSEECQLFRRRPGLRGSEKSKANPGVRVKGQGKRPFTLSLYSDPNYIAKQTLALADGTMRRFTPYPVTR
jgi:hypothetical protein